MNVFKDFLHIIRVTIIDISHNSCTRISLHPTPYSLLLLTAHNFLALRFITFEENNGTSVTHSEFPWDTELSRRFGGGCETPGSSEDSKMVKIPMKCMLDN